MASRPTPTNYILLCISTVVLCSSLGQAFFSTPVVVNEQPIVLQMNNAGSTYHWEDLFNDLSRIDPNLSYNLSVDTTQGMVTMANTYPAWVAYPDWNRLKPIVITSTETTTINQYIINFNIVYDNNMQSDFDDIRFADHNAYPLAYWIAKKPWDNLLLSLYEYRIYLLGKLQSTCFMEILMH